MEDTGIRIPGYLLDPRAEEFRPRNPSPENHFITTQLHHPQIYYPSYDSYPPSVYYDGCNLAYLQQQQQQSSSHTAYVSTNDVTFPPPPAPPQPLPPPLPPISTAATRVLLLTSVPDEVNEAIVRRDMEVFGEVRAVQMERLQQDGIVTVHFYDLRHAQVALKEIQEQHMQQQIRSRQHYNACLLMGGGNNMMNWGDNNSSTTLPFLQIPPPSHHHRGLVAGRVVWAQFTLPPVVPGGRGPTGRNQGTLVVFNLDSEVSEIKLKEIFEPFGQVKEIRMTPSKRQQRFLEFYDIRDAARALSEMDGKEINGKRVIIEFSRPGGHNYKSRNPIQSLSTTTAPSQQGSSKKSKSKADVITDSMSSLSMVGSESSNEAEGSYNNVSSSSNTNKKSGKSKSKSKDENKHVRSSKGWKSGGSSSSRQKSCLGANFLIDEAAIMESNCIRDTRTTVMIKNIPNKYSQKLLLNMLDNHCIHCNEQINDGDDQPLSSYDFLYLPIDFNNKCNVGYGFVNLTSPQAAWRLYKAFHLQPWEVFNSRKICEVTYARLQGLEALKEHFKNSKFACETEEYLPVVFSPPRDGKNQLTEPLAVGGSQIIQGVDLKSKTRKFPMRRDGNGDDDGEHDHDHDDDDEDEGLSSPSSSSITSSGVSEGIFANVTTGSSTSSSSSGASNLQVQQQHYPMGACR